MRSRALLLAIPVGAAAFFGACKPDPVTVGLRFPSTEMFLQSQTARIAVIDLAANDLGACPRLIDEAVNDSFDSEPVLDSGAQLVCRFRNGGVTFDEIDEGPKAFVGVARIGNTAILAGCTIGEAYNDAPPIDIVLDVTDQYRTTATATLTCANIDEKCNRGCQ